MRKWFSERLFTTLAFGLSFWFFVATSLGFLLWEAAKWSATLVGLSNFLWAHEILAGLVWLFAVYFSSGPLMLIAGSLFLTTFGGWKKLERALPFSIRKSGAGLGSFDASASFRQIIRAAALSLLIILGALLILIPPLLIFAVAIAAVAIGLEWTTTAEDLWGTPEEGKATWPYALGLGLIPALCGSIPFFGILSLPLLQIASSIRYDLKICPKS